MFTSSFKEGAEPIVLTPPEEEPPGESLNMVRFYNYTHRPAYSIPKLK